MGTRPVPAQGPIRIFPFMVARLGRREPAHERRKRAYLPARNFQLGQRVFVFARIDKLHRAILADADAVLRRLDSAAANALPCLDVFVHRLRSITSPGPGSSRPSSRLRSAVDLRGELPSLLCQILRYAGVHALLHCKLFLSC
jgi:hypothetical protein